jgi:hypothetical protein
MVDTFYNLEQELKIIKAFLACYKRRDYVNAYLLYRKLSKTNKLRFQIEHEQIVSSIPAIAETLFANKQYWKAYHYYNIWSFEHQICNQEVIFRFEFLAKRRKVIQIIIFGAIISIGIAFLLLLNWGGFLKDSTINL